MTEQAQDKPGSAERLFAMQLSGFQPGAKLEVAHGSFRGIGFGGRATVAKFDPENLELDVRVSKLLFHIDVKLKFNRDPEGTATFVGGRPDGKRTGSEPAQVKHTMTVKTQTPERTVFEFSFQDATRQLAVEKTYAKGSEALRITYDRYEMTLVPSR